MRGRLVLFLSTINTINEPHVEEMVEALSKVPASIIGFMFFTPLTEYKDVKGYKYTEEQRTDLAPLLDLAEAALEDLCLEGVAKAMNRFHR